MKMTSGVRLNERRKRALVRLQESEFKDSKIVRKWDGDQNHIAGAASTWALRRDAEIVTLKKRTGQLFN
jgi:hypothetical protein